jgi:hypothetical protein
MNDKRSLKAAGHITAGVVAKDAFLRPSAYIERGIRLSFKQEFRRCPHVAPLPFRRARRKAAVAFPSVRINRRRSPAAKRCFHFLRWNKAKVAAFPKWRAHRAVRMTSPPALGCGRRAVQSSLKRAPSWQERRRPRKDRLAARLRKPARQRRIRLAFKPPAFSIPKHPLARKLRVKGARWQGGRRPAPARGRKRVGACPSITRGIRGSVLYSSERRPSKRPRDRMMRQGALPRRFSL